MNAEKRGEEKPSALVRASPRPVFTGRGAAAGMGNGPEPVEGPVLSCILSAVEGLSNGRTRLCWRIGQGGPNGPKTRSQGTNSWRSWRLCVRFVVC